MTPAIVRAFLPVIAGLLLVLVIAFVLRTLQRRQRGDERWPFASKVPLSRVEQVLYFRLVQALPEHIVLAQVQLSRFLRVQKTSDHRSWLNRIIQKSADFLICEKDFSIVAAIELDDSTHERPQGIKRDETKNRALAAANVALIRWRASALPDDDAIRNAIDKIVSNRSTPVKPRPASVRIEPSLRVTRIDPKMVTQKPLS